jgi:choline-glycine betaine transporter
MAGMAAALGSGILTIFGGLDSLFGIPKSGWILLLIAASIVIAFCISAATGLMKGIKILSDYNIRVFFAIALFVFICGPTLFILQKSGQAFVEYFTNFLPRSVMNVVEEEPWANSWTTFYWANWMAWAPVTALFLGRLGYGYRVKTFVLMNAVLPSLFACVWMSIFSGTSLYFQQNGVDLYKGVLEIGPEAAIYGIFSELPFSKLTAVIFVLASFLSFVTAADSNTEAMSGLSSTGLSPDSPNPPSWIKLVLGGFIGFFAWFMVSNNGIEGVKQLSNIGGLPALFLLILVSISLIKVASKPDSYIESKEAKEFY